MTFESLWADIASIGRTRRGGYLRPAFSAADQEALAWFRSECERRGLSVRSDGFGNTVGWWEPRGDVATARRDAVLTGSHLDSVVDGGAYDGALGVAAALAAIDLLRDRGWSPDRPVGVAVFREEEGARFPQACLGSRLAVGAVTWDEVRGLRDGGGVALEDVTDPPGPGSVLDGVGRFLELHVEQGRDLVNRGAAVGVAERIWPHGRYRFTFTGEPNHAGTTRMEDRRDPMLAYAMTVLAANKQARLAGQRATFGRVQVEPNGTNAVASRVTGWLDARAEGTETLLGMVADIERLAVERAGRDGTDVVVTPESVSGEVTFDSGLARRLATVAGAPDRPLLPTAAGHDAGVVSAAGIPTAMLFVRNPTGVSHSPEETCTTEDCLQGVTALADAVADLAGPS